MISYLQGMLVTKAPTEAVVDVNGVGYGASIPLSTYEALPAPGTRVTLLTYLHVREDALQLFGFATERERSMFRSLLAVTGIGPRMAQTILSGIPVSDLQTYLKTGNVSALTTIPGVGRKLGERLVVELRDKVARLEGILEAGPAQGDPVARTRSEVLLALTSLGYARPVAEKAVHQALREMDEGAVSVESLLKASLRYTTK
jgi:Holliday junction DNA helicase RuvA